MRYWKGIVVAGALAALIAWGTSYYMDKVANENRQSPLAAVDKMEQEGVPDFELGTVDGKGSFRLSSLKGKILILNFWATWCGPCVEEFPAFVNMMKKLKGKVVLVTVASDENKSDVVNFLKTFKVTGEGIVNLWDPEKKAAQLYGTDRLPETYIVGRDMRLYRKISNSQKWDSTDAIEFLEGIAANH